MAKRKIKKKAWKNFEVIKVKLNPEQAALSCCSQPERGDRSGDPSLQCIAHCGLSMYDSTTSS